jgi:hypothetical protein
VGRYNTTQLKMKDENPEAEAAAKIHMDELFSLYQAST